MPAGLTFRAARPGQLERGAGARGARAARARRAADSATRLGQSALGQRILTQERCGATGRSSDAALRRATRRLRSQLSRTPEWGSLDERTRVAQLCEAAGPTQARLAAALRARHCAELRKSDLMYLSRIWGYRSDVWSRRKDRRYAPRDGGAPPPPPPAVLPAAAATLLPRAPALAAGACKCAEPPALDSLVREPAAKQVAAVQAEIAGPLRQLAERSIDAFSTEAGPSEMLLIMSSRGGTMPAAVLAIAATAMSHSSSHLQMAQAGLKRLLDGARQVHAELQLTLLRLTPAEGARPAFSTFAGKEAPWDVLLREVLLLSDFAIVCSTALEAVPAAAAAQQSSSTTDGGSGGDDEAVQLMISSCKKAHVALGGQLCMELVRVALALRLRAASLTDARTAGDSRVQHSCAAEAGLHRRIPERRVAQRRAAHRPHVGGAACPGGASGAHAVRAERSEGGWHRAAHLAHLARGAGGRELIHGAFATVQLLGNQRRHSTTEVDASRSSTTNT